LRDSGKGDAAIVQPLLQRDMFYQASRYSIVFMDKNDFNAPGMAVVEHPLI
jgi:hypothetical protein